MYPELISLPLNETVFDYLYSFFVRQAVTESDC